MVREYPPRQNTAGTIDAEFNGPGLVVDADNVRIEDLKLINGTEGIIHNGDGAVITTNEVQFCDNDGIQADGGQLLIRKNTCKGLDDQGIDVEANTPACNRVSRGTESRTPTLRASRPI